MEEDRLENDLAVSREVEPPRDAVPGAIVALRHDRVRHVHVEIELAGNLTRCGFQHVERQRVDARPQIEELRDTARRELSGERLVDAADEALVDERGGALVARPVGRDGIVECGSDRR